MNKNKTKELSKHLSYVLRHRPDAIELVLDPQGWAQVEDLILKSPEKLTREIIQHIVETSDKKRFILSENGQRIRANQGHSIKVDLGLKAINPPEALYHGTATRFLEVILREGLKKMNRQHVHLSAHVETATKVGSRHGNPVILTVDTARMASDGFKFYLSENKVWLTDVVPNQYIEMQD